MRLAPSPKRRPTGLILTALVLVLGFDQGHAVDAGKSPPHSFVRGAAARKLVKGFPNNVMPIVMVDDELPGILADFPGYTVDVVMQQCHSGGFGPVLTNLPVAVEWTFASSVQLKETSVSLDIMYPGWVGYLDNFTRAWYEDAVLYPAAGPGNGMKQHYETAISGRPAQANPAISAIPADLYAPPPRTVPVIIVQNQSLFVIHGTLNGNLGDYVFISGLPPGVQAGPGVPQMGWVPLVQAMVGKNKYWQVKAGDPGRGNLVPGPANQPAYYTISTAAAGGNKHSQYFSAGADSDNRSLALPTPNPDAVTQYAILVQWDEANYPRFGANLSRMANMLISTYKVPADNIVVLYNNGVFSDGTSNLPAYTLSPGTGGAIREVLPAVAVDSSTGYQVTNGNTNGFVFNDHAIKGELFKKKGKAGGNTPDEHSRLLFYSTGHGGQATGNVRARYEITNYRIGAIMALGGNSASGDGFDPVSEFTASLLSSLVSTNEYVSDITDLLTASNALDSFVDTTNLVQISTTGPIPTGAVLTIDGYTDPSWYPLVPVQDSSATLYDLDPLLPDLLDVTYTYQINLPNSVLYSQAENVVSNAMGLATIDGTMDLELNGIHPQNFDPNFISAVVVRGEEQETAYITSDPTTASALTAQDFGDGMLLTWPPAWTNYYIQQNDDLATTNWVTIQSPSTLLPELTGLADASLPKGTNWAFFSYTNSQMFFRLLPPP